MATGELDGSQTDKMSRVSFTPSNIISIVGGIGGFMEIQLADVRRTIRQYLGRILILVVLAVSAAGVLSFYVLKPQYEATVTLLVKKQNTGSQIAYDDLIASEKLVKTYGEIMKSRLVMAEVIETLKLPLTNEQLSKQIQIKADNESLITSVSVRDEDLARAVAIANEFGKVSMQKWNAIMEMNSVTIIDEAKQDQNAQPVYPRPYLNMGLAFVLSLLAGIGIALLRDYFDKTLKTEEEVEELFAIPVLGVIPHIKEQ
ncbi:hypothetical protein EDM56_17015 [Brevibacillus fluminis]|uniref:Capsular biosynthesis protein n=1 Tax=Brevibacillus fluminis TaxID=511487 RepID=A0A3M8DH06_9BACL|nr:Wzz/FepE/Etk N-terminal domain-containing protein [Brevibacillus fluminis]RNB87363.1 hypothetical protein EDM56_17015 [Brevibacillus fluminis]